MKIPAYVVEIMERSQYEFNFLRNHEHYAPGYTVKIYKRTAYTQINTFRSELERLVKWANRHGGSETAFILEIPTKTHHVNQFALVTIFDPIMQHIEQYIQK